MAESLHDRIHRRVRELADARAFKQAALARRVGLQPSSITRQIQGHATISYDVLEAVAEVAGVPVAELVVPDGALIKQLDADEAALLRILRRWPQTVRVALREFLQFFSDAPRGETQLRNLYEYWRRMRPENRELLYSCAVMLERGGRLPPDLRALLTDRLSGAEASPASEIAPTTPRKIPRRRS